MDSGQLTLEFEYDGKPVRGKDLSVFLYYFRIVYGVAQQSLSGVSIDELAANPAAYVSQIRKLLDQADPADLYGPMFFRDLGDDEIIIEWIRYGSPMKLRLRGVIYALVAALIFSGGEITITDQLHVKVPPVGVGAKSLMDAFIPNHDLNAESPDHPSQ